MEKSRYTLAWLALWASSSGSLVRATGQTAAPPVEENTVEQTATSPQKARKLDSVTVTGSLIPRSEIETATPILTITAKDMKARGFASVADALQQTSFATGAVQGSQSTSGFTPAAKTLSMFGLPVGFVKYLLDGRPLGEFPALYNGSQAFNSISGIPMDLVDHIDVLPGGQSSLYGSDAIAGVINIVLKKEVAAPIIDARYGWTTGGGHASRSVSFVDDYRWNRLHVLAGVQLSSTEPMWRFDRDLTSRFFNRGSSPPVASRDFLVYRHSGSAYYLKDPNQCAGLTQLFDGSEAKQTRSGGRTYCGSMRTDYSTLMNGEKEVDIYSHATWDAGDHLQLYGDILFSRNAQRYSAGSTFWDTSDSLEYYDPAIGTTVDLQRNFSPEEAGGYSHNMFKQYSRSTMATIGGMGSIGGSHWDYDLGLSHAEQHLANLDFVALKDPIDNYFKAHVLGASQGWHGDVPIRTPDYAAFYRPVPTEDFRSFTSFVNSHSKTWDNLLHGQLTNATLFSVPGGDAGVAIALEAANQGWSYVPDARFLNDSIWGFTSAQGGGRRSRYAATSEFRVPVWRQLTVDVSGRWDSYKVGDSNIHHGTYTLGLEYRPVDSLLLRGRYGTAFKMPSLPDEFQGPSGSYSSVTDYLNCARLGFDLGHINQCPGEYETSSFKRRTEGSLGLQPVTAKVWTFGAVWAPIDRMSINVDYLHWDIDNEVDRQSADQLSLDQWHCDTGGLSPTSGTCQQAFSQITRGPSDDPRLLGPITNIFTPKVNVSNEQVNAVTASVDYAFSLGRAGELSLGASYSDVLKHFRQQYPTDAPLDLFVHPGRAVDFKSKINGSVTWSPDKQWGTTLYVNRYGSQPNYVARDNDNYRAKGAGRLPPWILYNASVSYRPTEQLSLSFEVSNLFNKMPPLDRGYPGTSSSPFNSSTYNPFGRTMYLELSYALGKRS